MLSTRVARSAALKLVATINRAIDGSLASSLTMTLPISTEVLGLWNPDLRLDQGSAIPFPRGSKASGRFAVGSAGWRHRARWSTEPAVLPMGAPQPVRRAFL